MNIAGVLALLSLPCQKAAMRFQTFLILARLVSIVVAITYDPIQPPSFPLAVRNPYLSAWIPGDISNLSTTRAQFWTTAQLNWAVIARVNQVSYNLFGVSGPLANSQNAVVIKATYTSSHTIFIVEASGFHFTLDFLSPINPKDYVRQSLPFSYLTVSAAAALPGVEAEIQIYSDFDDSWNGQNLVLFDRVSEWNTTTSNGVLIWQINNLNATEYVEGGPNLQMASWGSAMYATQASSSSNLTTAAGMLSEVRSSFATHGLLSGSNGKYEVPTWTEGSVMGFSHDLGLVSNPSSVTFAIGNYRDCEVEYLGDCRIGYFRSEYNDPVSAAVFFLNDYPKAQAQSIALDSKIEALAIRSAGQNMADITALSARQTFGALDLTISKDTYNVSDAMVFLKEISSDGNVNSVDVIFPSFPQLYVLDPEYIRLLLEPIMQYLAVPELWPCPYVVHDLGLVYPIANGHPDGVDEYMPLEETGNLLILANIYVNASGNKAWAEKYDSLFQRYADYLATYGLYPAVQFSTDDFDGQVANQTNLAIKAAVGLTSYGAMSGKTNYTTKGRSFAHTLYDEGLGMDSTKTYFTFQYGDERWGMAYNLFPDFLMKLGTFDPKIFTAQSEFYPKVRSEDGVSLISNATYGKTDWMLWMAMTSSIETRDMFVSDVHAMILSGKTNGIPFTDKYDVSGSSAGGADSGNGGVFRARPVVGGEWSGLAVLGCNIA